MEIGRLAKLISERPQGGLPSNTESNPRKKINAITIQDEEGLVAPEPEQRQETVVSKGKGEVDHNDQKPERSSKNLHEPCSSNNKGPMYEECRLQIEELDEWWTQKSRTPDRLKPSLDELNTSPNQLKVGDKVLLDASYTRITTSEPNEEIPLRYSVFSHMSQAHGRALGCAHTTEGDTTVRNSRVKTGQKFFPNTRCNKSPWSCDKAVGEIAKPTRAYTMSSSRDKKTAVLASKKRKEAASSSVLPWWPSAAVECTRVRDCTVLYTKEFLDNNELYILHRRIHYSPSKYWRDLVPASTTYDPSRSKASVLPPSLRYLHSLFAHTLSLCP
ncbi:hypothetical protein GOBAR_AA17234 [Gossypium barbadense]|uniref:Uncharacterized protein n=1 Tax=Gossypium barbadense TaxID=3634 RepID=A0A2P5XJ97_GOSBA|nr:hypothetical protein GOBAR_AA17234 [Gossypium barbadense]